MVSHNSPQVLTYESEELNGCELPQARLARMQNGSALVDRTVDCSPEEQLRIRLLLALRHLNWHRLCDVQSRLGETVPSQIIDLLTSQELIALRTAHGVEEICATPHKDRRFELDPEFENLLPRSADEVAQLEARLLRERCLDPLKVWKGHGLLIDGYSPWRPLSLLGWSYEITEIELPDRAAVRDWIWAEHYGRRSYTPETKSYVRGQRYNQAKQQRGGDRRSQRSKGQCVPLIAQALAHEYQVHPKTIRRDARFARVLDYLAEVCGEAIRKVVLSQSIKISRSMVEHLAKLPQPLMKQKVEEALRSGKRPKLPTPQQPGDWLIVKLPRHNPRGQSEILVKRLGPKAVRYLRHALDTALLAAHKDHSDHGRLTTDRHCLPTPYSLLPIPCPEASS